MLELTYATLQGFLMGKPASLPCEATRPYMHPSKSANLKPYFSRNRTTFRFFQYMHPRGHSMNIATPRGMAKLAISSSLFHNFLNSLQCPLIFLTVALPRSMLMWVQEVPPVHGLENQSDDRLQVKISRHFSKVPLEHQSSFLSNGMTLHPFDQGVFSDNKDPGLVQPSVTVSYTHLTLPTIYSV